MTDSILARTFARPYARAVFELARQNHQLEYWYSQLQGLRTVFLNADIRHALRTRAISQQDLVDFLKSTEQFDWELLGLLLLELVQKKRLWIFPELVDFYEQTYYQSQQIVPIEISSAQALSPDHRTLLKQALSERLPHQKIILTERIVPELIKGFVLQVGDQILDFSIREQLQQLDFILKH